MGSSILAVVDPVGGRVDAQTSEGHPIAMDADPPHGGASAADPKDVVLAALAGCTAMDVAAILRKKRQSPARYEIAVSAESADAHPRVFTAITVEHRVTGDVQPEALRRSIELSSTRYCPVNAMLSRSVTIEHWYRLTDSAGTTSEAMVSVVGPDGSRVL
ncbi:MAG: OsmC family protein [Chloroflexota bacterium]|nr:OsmC family protein [Chloroflexota bacterium]